MSFVLGVLGRSPAFLSVMRVLVTGAAGFIGSHIVDALRADGHDVVLFDSLHPAVHNGRPSYLPDDALFYHCDVRDSRAVDRKSVV